MHRLISPFRSLFLAIGLALGLAAATSALSVGSPPEGKALSAYLKPETTVVAGDTADTDIAVAGIVTTDDLIEVLEIDIAGDAVADRTDEAAITSDGNIQLDTTDTTGSHLVVRWANLPA